MNLMDLAQIAGPLRKLTPRQEKVIRLYYGLGCQRPHAAAEVAQAFGVPVQAIAGILGVAQRRLAAEGLSCRQSARTRPARIRTSSAPGRRIFLGNQQAVPSW